MAPLCPNRRRHITPEQRPGPTCSCSANCAGRRAFVCRMHDLAVVVVSTNDRHWLAPCLGTVFASTGELELDVVVADNESMDGTAELVRDEFPEARVVRCSNRGF